MVARELGVVSDFSVIDDNMVIENKVVSSGNYLDKVQVWRLIKEFYGK